MLFDDYQDTQQVWRNSPPTNVYSVSPWTATISGFYIEELFNESAGNVEISITVSSGTGPIVVSLENAGVYTDIYTTNITASGVQTLSTSFSGLIFYTGMKVLSGVAFTIDSVYVGDRTVATKDDEFVDNVWKYIGNITGRIEPITAGYSSVRNNQTFADLSELDYVPMEYSSVIKSGDGIIDKYGVQRQVLGEPEIYPYMMESMILYLRRAQWSLNNGE